MSIAKRTYRYIDERPSIKDCMGKGLINYSALAREVCNALDIESFEAVLIACRRYADSLSQSSHEEKIIELLKRTKLRVRNKMSVAILDKPKDFGRIYALQKKIRSDKGDFNLIEGEHAVTILFNDSYASLVQEKFPSLFSLDSGLVQITMLFDEDIVTTSGVVAFVYTLLAEKGINIREEMSSWTDIMIIIEKEDLVDVMDVLSF